METATKSRIHGSVEADYYFLEAILRYREMAGG